MAKERMYKAMVCQTVVVSRPDPNGKPDKDGKVPHIRTVPEIGKVFEFTQAEMQDLAKMAPSAVRDPKNESIDFDEGADQAGAAAAAIALTTGGAAGDAFRVAATAAKGKGRLPKAEASEGSDVALADEDEDL